MPEARRIAALLRHAYEGPTWHGPSVREALAGLDAATAAARPIPAAHTIFELVHHIAAWERIAALRLEGRDPGDPSAAEDWPPVTDTTDQAWQHALAALEQAQQALRAAFARLDDARLEQAVPGQRYSLYALAHGVIGHDIYHAGQIALLRKATARTAP